MNAPVENQTTSATKPPSLSDTAIRQRLVAAFPNCFCPKGKPKKPLAIGIGRGLHWKLAEAGYFVRPWQLQRAIADYTSGPTYLREMVVGARRYSTDGSPAGEVTAFDQDYAEKRLAAMGLSLNKLQVAALHPAAGSGLSEYAVAGIDSDDEPSSEKRFVRDTPPGLAGCGDIDRVSA